MGTHWPLVWTLITIGSTPSFADGPSSGSEKSLAERYAGLKKEWESREKKFREDLAAAGHDARRNREVNDRFFEDYRRVSGSIGALMKAHPDDPTALEGALIILGTMRWSLDEDIVPIVRKNAVTDPRAGELCFLLQFRGGERYAEEILREVAAHHPRREVRGQAVLALGDYHRNAACTLTYRSQLRRDRRS